LEETTQQCRTAETESRHIAFHGRQSGAVEYGLLAAFVAAIALAVIIADPLGLSSAVEGAYQSAVDALTDVTP
jgi:Flp pilus assembly pilin Flp